jgi:choline dehydrogenase-like flavoprotein
LISNNYTVGAGSAGAVLANRLSKNNKVLLLEAGGDPLWYNYIPGLAPELLHRTEVDWAYKTTPQKTSCDGMQGNLSPWPRGKLLGGSSNLNYMFYVRGSPHDYNNWAKLTGDETWKYENVLPYFKKSEDYRGSYKDDGGKKI